MPIWGRKPRRITLPATLSEAVNPEVVYGDDDDPYDDADEHNTRNARRADGSDEVRRSRHVDETIRRQSYDKPRSPALDARQQKLPETVRHN